MEWLVLQHRKAQHNGIRGDLLVKGADQDNLYILFLFGLLPYTVIIKASVNFARYKSLSFNITGEENGLFRGSIM